MYENIDAYVASLVNRSTPDKTAWNMELIRSGEPTRWNYIDGCMLTALQSLGEITGNDRYLDFVVQVMDYFVDEDGTIRRFKIDAHELDSINEGRVLFAAYQRTGKEKYRKAIQFLHDYLKEQPRTAEGSYWHKKVYVNQVWLDGIYMAMPFQAMYERAFGTPDYSDILHQIRIVRERMRDPVTGLYYHGYDSSRSIYWADSVTGLSKSFWLRAIGWFSIALADLLEIIREPDVRDELSEIFRDLMESISVYADPESGMYYQVVDQGGREGNYLECSGSSMIAYSMLKGVRLGILDSSFRSLAEKTFNGIIRCCMVAENGEIRLKNICLVAGLGDMHGRPRDGTFEYYISEPVVENDAKGVAPFVLCYSEIIRANQASKSDTRPS